MFEDAYHGGVLTFAGGGSPMNVPFDFVTAPFNDIEATRACVKQHEDDLVAILVELLLGAAGNVPAEAAFLAMLREEATRCGAMLIFDEVKTSPLGHAGLQGHYGVVPDMTTLGKYLGAGLSFGAFGGSKALMDRFDPRLPGALRHAGTFNNNIMSMSGGLASLRSSFTPDAAEAFLQRAEAFRTTVNARLVQASIVVCLSRIGSILSLHIGARPPMKVSQIHPQTMLLRQLVHLNCLVEAAA